MKFCFGVIVIVAAMPLKCRMPRNKVNEVVAVGVVFA